MRHSKAPLRSLAWKRNSPVGPVLERLWGNVVTEAPQSGTRRQLQLMGGGGMGDPQPPGHEALEAPRILVGSRSVRTGSDISLQQSAFELDVMFPLILLF